MVKKTTPAGYLSADVRHLKADYRDKVEGDSGMHVLPDVLNN